MAGHAAAPSATVSSAPPKVYSTMTGRPKAEEYEFCERGLAAFFKANPGIDTVARMATVSSYLRHHFPRNYFVGFYTVMRDGVTLQIGPYTGNGVVLAAGVIPFGKGQCGACAAAAATQIVQDVRTCSNYIACDEDSLSEIVVPVFALNRHDEPDATPGGGGERRLIAVLDIDADVVGAYDEVDRECLERLVARFI